MDCQVVVFPEGALYWSEIAVHKPTKAELDAAITQIGRKAGSEDIYVVFGVGLKPLQTSRQVSRISRVTYWDQHIPRAGWDFIDETDNGTDDIWWINDEGQDYSRLWWELDSL